jgi:abequosyltransferase
MDKGIVHRYKMAIEGYHHLANTFFGEDSVEAFHVRRVVRNEFPAIRSLLNLKLESTEKGNREELVLLDSLAAKVYKDATVFNRIHLLVYKFMPLYVFKAGRIIYKAARPLLKRQDT